MTISLQPTNTTCGSSNGAIFTVVNGGTSPYTFSDNGGPAQGSDLFTGLAAGTHLIRVQDAQGKKASASVTLTNAGMHPALTVAAQSAPAGCNADGTITLSVSGGSAPYQYSADGINAQASPSFTNLSAGAYSLYATDAAGCSSSLPFIFPSACSTIVNYDYSKTACTNDGWLIATADASGALPYTYSLDGGAYQASGNFVGLASGLHHLYTKDNNGNISVNAFPIQTHCDLTVTATPTDSRCSANNGTLTVTATGGRAPIYYSVAGRDYQTGNTIGSLAPGSYTVLVKDAGGSVGSLTGLVIGQFCHTLTADITPSSCSTYTGIITVTNAEGTAPIVFSIDGINYQSGRTFSSLPPGNYNLSSRDANNMISTLSLVVGTVNGPNISSSTTPTPCTLGNGTITTLATSGLPPYSFQLNNGAVQATGIFTGLRGGDYSVIVTDGNGCSAVQTMTILTTDGPAIDDSVYAATCSNTDGAIEALGSGGTAPLSYTLDNGALQTATLFNDLISKTYTLKVQDAQGCTAEKEIIVPLINGIIIDAGTALSVCIGSSVSLAGYTSTSDFSWSPATGLSDANALNPVATPALTTKYYLTAHSGVCTSVDSVLVTVDTLPLAHAGPDALVCYGHNIQLQGSGGSFYQWTPADFLDNPQSPHPTVVDPVQSVTYSLSVKDNNGCSSASPDKVQINVTPEAKVFAGNDTTVQTNVSFPLHASDVNNSGFTEYTWSPADGLDNASSQNPAASIGRPQTYTVEANTDNHCTAKAEIHINTFQAADILVPKAFTPNHDGNNDILHAIPLGIRDFHYFLVINRWGQQVFRTQDPSKGWDGLVGGLEQELSTYIWEAEGVDYYGKWIHRKGTVLLIR